jgi:uncharacterized spore protein YtfJ
MVPEGTSMKACSWGLIELIPWFRGAGVGVNSNAGTNEGMIPGFGVGLISGVAPLLKAAAVIVNLDNEKMDVRKKTNTIKKMVNFITKISYS